MSQPAPLVAVIDGAPPPPGPLLDLLDLIGVRLAAAPDLDTLARLVVAEPPSCLLLLVPPVARLTDAAAAFFAGVLPVLVVGGQPQGMLPAGVAHAAALPDDGAIAAFMLASP